MQTDAAGQSPGSVARCSFENPGRVGAWSLVPPDSTSWGGGAAAMGDLGAMEGLSEMEGEEMKKERGPICPFSNLLFSHEFGKF